MPEQRRAFPWPEWEAAELLGRGTYGEVYKVRKEEYGHVSYAAVKVIRITADMCTRRELESTGVSMESYLREVQASLAKEIDIMESLKGASHIVGIEDSRIQREEDGWSLFIRMELLTSLSGILKERRLSMDEILKLGCDICVALEACRKKNIIHRDIKPDNIFVSEFGEYKLGDFGVSRYLEYMQAGSTVAGTRSYMAPEVYRGEKYGATVDLYSLGLVLYQIANNGRKPFLPTYGEVGYNALAEADSRRYEGEKFPDPVMGGRLLGDVLRKVCAFQAKDRYQTPEEFGAALKGLQEKDLSSVQYNGNMNTGNIYSEHPAVRQKNPIVMVVAGLGVAVCVAVLILGFLNRDRLSGIFSHDTVVEEEGAEIAAVEEKKGKDGTDTEVSEAEAVQASSDKQDAEDVEEDPSEAENHDLEDSDTYRAWEHQIISEAAGLWP